MNRDIFERVRRATNNGQTGAAFKEIQRIVSLPVVGAISPEEVEALSADVVQAQAFDEGFRLMPGQAAAVLAYNLLGGGLFPLGVGQGKTLVSLLIAELAYRSGITKSIIFLPSQVYPQLMLHDLPHYRRKVTLSVPFIGMGDASPTQRRRSARSRIAACHVMPYSTLSTRDAEDLLTSIAPQLVIADEAHNLKNSKAARTKRVQRLLRETSPQLVAMSGTITSKSIMDYWHLISHALHLNSPLPLLPPLALAWAALIDANAEHNTSSSTSGPIMPLVRWANHHFPEEKLPENVHGFRRAYKLRLVSSPGVVASGDADIGTSLILSNTTAQVGDGVEGWDRLNSMILDLRTKRITPVGDEIEHAIHAWKWAYELSAGFYNELYWPSPEQVAKRARCAVAQAEELLERAFDHHELQQEYHRALRKWLSTRSRPRLDTPMLVGLDMHNHGARNVGEALYTAWRDMKLAEFDGMPERLSRPIRVCPYKIDAAVRWAAELEKGEGALIWYWHNEIGSWLFEELEKAGLNPLHCPAGPEGNTSIIDPANHNRPIVASIGAHGTGKNLQALRRQIVVQWPRSAVAAEQMLGRVHRTGQTADELVVERLDTTWVDALNFAACLNDAAYIHFTAVRQKLMYASYINPPPIFSASVLAREGLEAVTLTDAQRQDLEDRFGDSLPDIF